MIEQLKQFFKKPATETSNEVPEGVCPNCWGQQEYDKTIRDMYVDKQIDVNNHESHHAFIRDFVVNQIDGISLRKGDNGYQCPTCRIVKP